MTDNRSVEAGGEVEVKQSNAEENLDREQGRKSQSELRAGTAHETRGTQQLNRLIQISTTLAAAQTKRIQLEKPAMILAEQATLVLAMPPLV